jgi:hypothetical protein
MKLDQIQQHAQLLQSLRDFNFERFRKEQAEKTALILCRIELQAAGVDLSTPEGLGLLRDRYQRQMNSAGTQGEKQRLAGAKCRALVKAARQLSKPR